jgi:predicted ABC-type transport system involved in lysophospholipase L1 biosynthesis ATPase subunit
MSENRVSLITRGPLATREIGRSIGQQLRAGSVIALIGELGCGKTCFTQGLCAGLGIPSKQVNSPTFAFVKLFVGRPISKLETGSASASTRTINTTVLPFMQGISFGCFRGGKFPRLAGNGK